MTSVFFLIVAMAGAALIGVVILAAELLLMGHCWMHDRDSDHAPNPVVRFLALLHRAKPELTWSKDIRYKTKSGRSHEGGVIVLSTLVWWIGFWLGVMFPVVSIPGVVIVSLMFWRRKQLRLAKQNNQ